MESLQAAVEAVQLPHQDPAPLAAEQDLAQTNGAGETAEQSSEAGRARRSRRDRPCDLCRRQKHICVIPVRGDPCKACQSRKRPCTFDDPPTTRVRKPKTTAESSEEPERRASTGADVTPIPDGAELPQQPSRKRPRSRGSFFSSSAPDASAFSLTGSILDLVRSSRDAPRIDDAATPASLFVPGEGSRTEMSYISPGTFADLTFSTADSHQSTFPGDVVFRQVSNDPTKPVFFISGPTLMYGYIAPESERLWQSACSVLSAGAPQRLIEIYLNRSQPAIPILDMSTFAEADPAILGSKGVSYALLTGLVAHATSYVHEIRSVHKHLWRQVVLPLEDEFRKPTFQTIQTAIIILSSRPAINVAQNHIAMGRVVSAAHLLGLHLDPTLWRVPASERALRKRLWWTILIHDKMRALWFGRPSTISASDWNVPMPSLADLGVYEKAGPAQRGSAESYLAWCKMTSLLDSLIADFYTVRACSTARSVDERLALLEGHGMRLRGLEAELSVELRTLPSSENRPELPAASGVRSFQLCKLGVEMSLLRLTTASFEPPSSAQIVDAARATVTFSHALVEFLENLLPAEFDMFWAPYCSFIISAAGALMLRTAIAVGSLDATLRNTTGVLFARLVVTLTSSHHAAHWDVASLALDRIATLLRSLDGQLPELTPLLQLFGAPNHVTTISELPSGERAHPLASPPYAPSPHPHQRPVPTRAFSDLAPSTTSPGQHAPFLSPRDSAPMPLPFLGPATGTVMPSFPPMPSTTSPASTNSTFLPPPLTQAQANGAQSASTPWAAANTASVAAFGNEGVTGQSGGGDLQPLDPLWWMNTDILSLPDHFGTLPDLFDQAIGFIGGGGLEHPEGASAATGATTQSGEEATAMTIDGGGGVSVGGPGGGGGGGGGTAGGGTQTPIGPNGLFDLRSFLEGGGISTL